MTRAAVLWLTLPALLLTACNDAMPVAAPLALDAPAEFAVRGRWPNEPAGQPIPVRYRIVARGLPFAEAARVCVFVLSVAATSTTVGTVVGA